ncbi:APC membrane recruitment protein 2, partial [Carlito syrichta]|uniref:APC membrane recruitment protein 2 n=1 Tax=Carlito syrichta TaxID=1868482 RepID=A0A3Q0E1D2_CARSF
SDVTSLKSFDSLTGCGDIIADQEDEAGPSCDKHAPGPGQPAPPKKNPGVVSYQGGGEEMASPDGVDDTCLQEFWDMLSQTEGQGQGQGQGPPEGAAKAAALPDAQGVPEAPQDSAKDASSVKRRRLHRIPIEPHPKEEPKHPEKEPQEGVPNSDEGCLSRLKPVSPGTITCPLRTPGSLLKDSKIPISIKHLANLPSSHPVAHQQPARSEMPRTKIPVSKVLVRRVSGRGLAGTTIRAAACHDSAKKL